MPLPKWLARSNRHVANRIIGPVAPWLPLMGVLHHVGRRSGRSYAIPLNVFRDGDDYVFALTYGSDTDWVKNVLASGRCDLVTRRQKVLLGNPRLTIDREKQWAPVVVRFILARLGVHEVLRMEQRGA